jgi:L-fucose isomerase
LPKSERERIDALTDPTWPHVHARLTSSFDEFLALFPCNHVMGTSGDQVRALNYVCEICGITPLVLGPEGKDRIPPIWERVTDDPTIAP